MTKKIDIEELKARISYEELYDLYITQNKTRQELLEYYRITNKAFIYILNDYHINKNNINKKQLDLEIILDLYITKNYTIDEIIKILSISQSVLTRFLKKNNIKKPKDKKVEKIKETYYDKTGYFNPSQNPDIKKKKQDTCLKNNGYKTPLECPYILNKMHVDYYNKTGYKVPAQNPEIIQKMSNNYLEKTGYKNPSYNPKVREKRHKTYKEKTGYDFPAQNPEIRIKQLETKKVHGTINTSKPEEEVARLLLVKFPQTQRQYRSEVYPFACDFYISELDLYIEYQGTWTHGKEPYNHDNQEHQQLLAKWQEKAKVSKFYKGAIDVWTYRDPLKRQIAAANHLNWLEFFTMDQFLIWYNSLS